MASMQSVDSILMELTGLKPEFGGVFDFSADMSAVPRTPCPDVDVINTSVKDLNRLLAEKGIDKAEVAEIRKVRRQEKNKTAAKRCREKKSRERVELESKTSEMQSELRTQMQLAQSYLAKVAEESNKRLAVERENARLTVANAQLTSQLAVAESKLAVAESKLAEERATFKSLRAEHELALERLQRENARTLQFVAGPFLTNAVSATTVHDALGGHYAGSCAKVGFELDFFSDSFEDIGTPMDNSVPQLP
eukprot:Opistho-2@90071